jgi:MFS family permease
MNKRERAAFLAIFNYPLNRWSNVVGGALAHAVGAGVLTYAFSMFIKPISTEYGWDRGAVGLASSFFFVANGFGCLMLGAIMNRWGVRLTTIVFVTLYGVALMSVAAVPPSILVLYLIFSAIGLFGAVASAQPYAVVICAWFDRRRGLALGILSGGAAIGISLMPSAATYVLGHYGWRAAYISIGVISIVVAVTVLLFLIRMPPGYNSDKPSTGRTQRAGSPSYRQILRRREFWLIFTPIFGVSMALFGVNGNMVPIMTDRGWTPAEAAGVISMIGFSSWASKLLVGYVMDKVLVRYVAISIFGISIVGILCIMNIVHGVVAFLGVFCMGFSQGAEAGLITYMTSRYFSPREYSKAVGAVWCAWTWGAALGNGISNLSFHVTKSYNPALWFFIVLTVVCIVVLSRLGIYIYPEGSTLDD